MMGDDMGVAGMTTVLLEVAEERIRQVTDHARTPDADDKLNAAQWGWLLSKRSMQLGYPFPGGDLEDDPRRLLVEIAAIAVAGIEAIDRHRDGETAG
jgi:hypothetical protein